MDFGIFLFCFFACTGHARREYVARQMQHMGDKANVDSLRSLMLALNARIPSAFASRAAALKQRSYPAHAVVVKGFGQIMEGYLDMQAEKLMEQFDGDVQKATLQHMGYTFQHVKDNQPELWKLIIEKPSDPVAHRFFTEVTWDAVATFLPQTHALKPEGEDAKKIATVAVAGKADPTFVMKSVLDVGCGDGLLLPFLVEGGMPASAYRGIDVSPYMVSRALERQAAWPEATFQYKSFQDVVAEIDDVDDDTSSSTAQQDDKEKEGKDNEKETDEDNEDADEEDEDDDDFVPEPYDSIYFLNTLQFFASPAETIKNATRLLARKPSSRIVLSHMRGNKFVKRERSENNQTVLSIMPSLDELTTIADDLGLDVITPSFFGQDPKDINAYFERDFYLAILCWKGAAQEEMQRKAASSLGFR